MPMPIQLKSIGEPVAWLKLNGRVIPIYEGMIGKPFMVGPIRVEIVE